MAEAASSGVNLVQASPAIPLEIILLGVGGSVLLAMILAVVVITVRHNRRETLDASQAQGSILMSSLSSKISIKKSINQTKGVKVSLSEAANIALSKSTREGEGEYYQPVKSDTLMKTGEAEDQDDDIYLDPETYNNKGNPEVTSTTMWEGEEGHQSVNVNDSIETTTAEVEQIEGSLTSERNLLSEDNREQYDEEEDEDDDMYLSAEEYEKHNEGSSNTIKNTSDGEESGNDQITGMNMK